MGFNSPVTFGQTLAYGQRYAVGNAPYNVSAVQNTDRNKALATALWVSTPRYLCPNSDLGRIAPQAVQSVMNVSSAKLHKQGTVRSHGGIGEG